MIMPTVTRHPSFCYLKTSINATCTDDTVTMATGEREDRTTLHLTYHTKET